MKFEVEKDIAIISLDIPNAKVNTLTQSLMNDFVKVNLCLCFILSFILHDFLKKKNPIYKMKIKVLDHLDKSSGIRGAVLISSKPEKKKKKKKKTQNNLIKLYFSYHQMATKLWIESKIVEFLLSQQFMEVVLEEVLRLHWLVNQELLHQAQKLF